MPTHDDTEYRRFEAPAEAVELRQPEDADDGDGLYRIRMPVSSTAEARDGDAFTRDRLRGFADQIAAGDVGVFLDHGRSPLGDARYSALGKVGYWDAPEVVDRDGGADLVADAVLMDPTALDAEVGPLRSALATLKAQARVGVPLASSVGWSEDTGEREVPGDADLLEISIVGIPSDPRTTTASADEAQLARAVDAAAEDFDVDTFVRELQGTRATDTVNGEEVDITPPEAAENACALGLARKEEFGDAIGDCGTGDGEETARRVVNGNLTAEYIADEIAPYLTSHEDDVAGITDPPSDWDRETWTDGCGPVQYALWAGTATGTGREWAQRVANDYAEATDEEVPYPDRAMDTQNLDDPEFSPGDAVVWSWDDTPVHGRVNDIHEQFTPPEADEPITGEDGEAVYSIYEYDEETEELADEPNVGKPESSLNESTKDIPTRDMSDDDTAGDDPGDDRDEPTLRDMEQEMAEVREMMEENTRMCREMYEKMMGDENADGMDGDEDADGDEDEENAADAGDEGRTLTVDGDPITADDIRALREEAADADAAAPETTDRADTEDTEDDTDGDAGFGFAGMED